MKRLIVLLSLSIGAVGVANCGGGGDDIDAVDDGGSPYDGSARGGTNRDGSPGTVSQAKSDATSVDAIADGSIEQAQDGSLDAQPDHPSGDSSFDATLACPAQKPQDGVACPNEQKGEVCAYGTMSCRCRLASGTWQCTADAGPDTSVTCPAALPQDTSSCPPDLRGDTCTYATASCECRVSSGNWRCTATDAGSSVTCPAALPQDSSSCPSELRGDTCSYTGASCRCRMNGSWQCSATDAGVPGTCPNAQPQEATSCPLALRGDSCNYAAASCECRSSSGNWRCTTKDAGHDAQVSCPTAQPQSASTCPQDLRGDTCNYATATCECRTSTGSWRCTAKDAGHDAQAACPTVQPQSASTCPEDLRGDTCNYATASCRCRSNPATWLCTAIDAGQGCPAMEPKDYASCSLSSSLTCDYEGLPCRCRARDDRWWCPSLPADAGCPASAPPRNSACQAALTCPYSGGTCTCNPTSTADTGGRWQCTGDAGLSDAAKD